MAVRRKDRGIDVRITVVQKPMPSPDGLVVDIVNGECRTAGPTHSISGRRRCRHPRWHAARRASPSAAARRFALRQPRVAKPCIHGVADVLRSGEPFGCDRDEQRARRDVNRPSDNTRATANLATPTGPGCQIHSGVPHSTSRARRQRHYQCGTSDMHPSPRQSLIVSLFT